MNRSELADFLQRTNVARFDLPFVNEPWRAKYRIFRRANTKETLTQIKTSDLLDLKSAQVWKKYE